MKSQLIYGLVCFEMQFRPGKKLCFGSGQLIFENWSGVPILNRLFFWNHNLNFPNLIKCQHAEMDADAEAATWRCQVLDVT